MTTIQTEQGRLIPTLCLGEFVVDEELLRIVIRPHLTITFELLSQPIFGARGRR